MLLTENQLGRMSNIFDNAGQVTLGSVVVPYLLKWEEGSVIYVGIAVTISLWLVSLSIEKVLNNE